MTKRTTDEWQTLLDGATPGPWRWYWDHGTMTLEGADTMPVATDLHVHDSDLLAAAPEAVAEVVRLCRELEELLDTLSKAKLDSARGDYEYGQHTGFLMASSRITRILEGGADE